MVLIPIIKIKKIIDALLTYIEEDLATNISNNTETQSFLYLVLGGQSDADYDPYVQAKSFFQRSINSSRKINTSIGFSMNIENVPHVYIRHPHSNPAPFQGIGYGYEDLVLDDDPYTTREALSYSQKNVTEIVVTTTNPLETITISTVLYAAIIAANDTFNEFMATKSLSMREMMLNSETQSKLYFRSITFEHTQIDVIPKLYDSERLGKIIFNQADLI